MISVTKLCITQSGLTQSESNFVDKPKKRLIHQLPCPCLHSVNHKRNTKCSQKKGIELSQKLYIGFFKLSTSIDMLISNEIIVSFLIMSRIMCVNVKI